MYANGFFEQQQRRHPASFALVVALHAAAFGALILAGSTQFLQEPETRITVRDIIIPDPPPPDPVLDPPEPRPERETRVTTVPRERPANDNNTVTTGRSDPVPTGTGQSGQGTGEIVRDPPPPDPPPPVRREAQLDPRYAGDLQPPYPERERIAGRGGLVRLRLTIAPNGRVTAVERLSATSDAFWRATEPHVLRRWRFRPATLDGRPVQGIKVMTINFRIEDA